MDLIPENRYFAIKDNTILAVVFIKYTKRGTGGFFITENHPKPYPYLISLGKVYPTREQAEFALHRLRFRKKRRDDAREREYQEYRAKQAEIHAVFERILVEFDIKVPAIMQPSTLREAKACYREFKRLHEKTKNVLPFER